MIGIVDQLLDVTRSRIGQGIHISPSETTIRGVVTDVLEEMRLAQPSLQATLSGDDSRMWWRKRALSTRTATSRSLLKLERRLSDDHYVACLREATVASVFWRS